VGSRPKFPYVRSTGYLRFVASQPCFICQRTDVQACHANQSKWGKAKSIKATDTATFPLCIRHHYEHDMCYEMTKEDRDVIEDQFIERMRVIAEAEGWYDGVKRKTKDQRN
jgi:hypothetical protein